jgi:hypothetical protein
MPGHFASSGEHSFELAVEMDLVASKPLQLVRVERLAKCLLAALLGHQVRRQVLARSPSGLNSEDHIQQIVVGQFAHSIGREVRKFCESRLSLVAVVPAFCPPR